MDDQRTVPGHDRLDATAGRDVVYCHQCENEWYRDTHGIICPRCDSEATEIVSGPKLLYFSTNTSLQVSPANDPRPRPPPNDGLSALHNHDPWEHDADPEEEDIEQYLPPHMGSGQRGSGRPNANGVGEMPEVMGQFQRMIASMMGPGVQQAPVGRSGRESLFGNFPPNHDHMAWPRPPSNVRTSTFNAGNLHGTHITFTIGGNGSRGNMPGQGPPVDDINRSDTFAPEVDEGRMPNRGNLLLLRGSADDFRSLLTSMFGVMGPNGQVNDARHPPGFPPGLANLLASLGNPANAINGDAVYTQEALDRIISNMMDTQPTSNAPGPAPASAIASLPKKAVDEKILGPEGKADCSVCMEDVSLGEEVVVLPCTHWFHEACASAWLNEHNTCPICRTGIGENAAGTPNQPASASARATDWNRPNERSDAVPPMAPRRRSTFMQNLRGQSQSNRDESDRQNRRPSDQNAARLQHIRNIGNSASGDWASNSEATDSHEAARRRYQVIGDSANIGQSSTVPSMPGSFDSYGRPGSQGRSYGEMQSPSRRSSASTGSSNHGGTFSWLRRLGSNNSSDRNGGNGGR